MERLSSRRRKNKNVIHSFKTRIKDYAVNEGKNQKVIQPAKAIWKGYLAGEGKINSYPASEGKIKRLFSRWRQS